MGGLYMCADSATWKLPLLSECLQLCTQGGEREKEREHSGTLRNKIRKNKACFPTVSKQSLPTSPSGSAALNATRETIQSERGWGIRTHSRHNYSLDCFVFLSSVMDFFFFCTNRVLDQFGQGVGVAVLVKEYIQAVNYSWKPKQTSV